jgi:hypothetical protein
MQLWPVSVKWPTFYNRLLTDLIVSPEDRSPVATMTPFPRSTLYTVHASLCCHIRKPPRQQNHLPKYLWAKLGKGCAMAYEDSHRPLTAETMVQTQVSPYGISRIHSDIGHFLRLSPVGIIPPWLSTLTYSGINRSQFRDTIDVNNKDPEKVRQTKDLKWMCTVEVVTKSGR